MTTQHLKTMLQDIINDRPEQAQAAMHEYFIAKSRELTEGLASTVNTKNFIYYKHPSKKGNVENLNGDEAIDGVGYDEDTSIIQIGSGSNFKPSHAELEKRGWRKMDSAQAEKAMGLKTGGQPVIKESFVDGNFSHGTLTSVSKLPKTIMSNLDCSDNKISSLRGINKYVKTIKGTADFTMNNITSGGLGLLEIDGLKSVMLDNKKVAAIINKHLKGDRDVTACQEELIENGFDDFAQL